MDVYLLQHRSHIPVCLRIDNQPSSRLPTGLVFPGRFRLCHPDDLAIKKAAQLSGFEICAEFPYTEVYRPIEKDDLCDSQRMAYERNNPHSNLQAYRRS